MNLTEDLLQWIFIVILLMVAFSSLWSSISNSKLTKEVYRQAGKMEMLEKTYIEVFKKLNERLTAAMEEKV